MLTLDQDLWRHPDAVYTEVETNELVLLNLASRTYFSLNVTGMRVSQGLKEQGLKEELSLRDTSTEARESERVFKGEAMHASGTNQLPVRQGWGKTTRRSGDVRLVMAILILALAVQGAAFAAVFNCPGPYDPIGTEGAACLTAAINTANQHPDPDTIILGPSDYKVSLNNTSELGPNGLPVISSPLTIQGECATSTGAAHIRCPTIQPIARFLGSVANYRIFQVAPSGNLTLKSLIITGGKLIGFPAGQPSGSGGGILNLGTLTLETSVVTGNSVAGHREGGCETVGPGVSGSAVKGLGGGIRNLGKLIINNSLIYFNHSDLGGGGIASSGSASISNSRILFNGFADGAGIFTEGGDMTIDNSTIAFNSSQTNAGAGILVGSGTLSVNNSTIARNSLATALVCLGGGGGIDNEAGTVELQNTILASNTAVVFAPDEPPPPAEAPGPDCFGSIISLGNNLVGDPSDCTITLLASDRTGDPGLLTFSTPSFLPIPQVNDGYFRLTSTSQAVDAGDPASCTLTDQLGHSRIDGDGDGTVICDIGAIEFSPGAILVNELLSLAPLVTTFRSTPVPGGPAGTFTIRATFTNTSATPIHDPVFKVTELSGGNLLLNADRGLGDIGATLTGDAGPDAILSPGESLTAEFVIGLQARAPFTFLVDLLGVPQP